MARASTVTASETPPYVSYSTFKNTLNQLRENGALPSHIDASVLNTLSGSARGALISALRFFDLIGSDNRPTEKLKALHKANTDEEKVILKGLLTKHYPDLVPQLQNGTPIALRNAFTGANTERMKKECLRFFVTASRDAGFAISPLILAKNPVRQPTKRRSDAPRRASVGKARHSTDVETRDGGGGVQFVPSGFRRLPFPVGVKIWEALISEQYTDEDVVRFTEMIKMALLRKAK